MNTSSDTPKPYVVEHWIYHAKRWCRVAFCETEGAALEELDKLGLHRQDKARVKDLNTGRAIHERTGTD